MEGVADGLVALERSHLALCPRGQEPWGQLPGALPSGASHGSSTSL